MNKKQSKVMRSFQVKMMTQLAQWKFSSVDLKNDLFVKWLVSYMAETRIPFKLVPLGGGVTRIIHSGGLCPLCEGSGIIHADEHLIEETPSPASILPEDKRMTRCASGGECNCKGGCSEGGPCCGGKHKAA